MRKGQGSNLRIHTETELAIQRFNHSATFPYNNYIKIFEKSKELYIFMVFYGKIILC